MKSSALLCEVAELIDSLHKTPKYSDSGKPMVRVTDVKYGNLDLSKTFKVSDHVFEEFSRRYTPKKGDIIITRVGTYGVSAKVEDTNFCMGQNISVIIPRKICPDYLYSFLNSKNAKQQIESSVVGSTQKTLSLKAINALRIPRFDHETEVKIGKLHSTFDKKIHVNNLINSKLEKITQTLFQSWFVDFDPVYAKNLVLEKGLTPAQAERAAMAIISGVCGPSDFAENFEEIDKKLSAKLSKMSKEKQEELAHTASLFPSEFEDSELGEIPKGWRESSIGNIAANIRENKKSSDLTKDDIYIGLEHIDRKNLFLSRWNSGDVVESNKSAFKQGDILFGKLRPYFHKICITPFSGVCSTDILVVREREIKYKNFILFTINQEEFVEYANIRSTGTRMPRANWKDMADYKTIIPSEDLLSTFNSIVSSFIEKGNSNTKENVSLESLRDTLLPKLLSGEIDLSKIKIDEVHDE